MLEFGCLRISCKLRRYYFLKIYCSSSSESVLKVLHGLLNYLVKYSSDAESKATIYSPFELLFNIALHPPGGNPIRRVMILQALESNGGLQFTLLIYVAWTSYGSLPTQRA